MIDVWMPFHDGKYEIRNDGLIRRPNRNHCFKPGTFITGTVAHNGYRVVMLYPGKKRKLQSVHRLVAAAFLGPCPEGMVVNHKDGNKLNNHVGNLEYISDNANRAHASRMGLVRKSKILDTDAAEMRRLRAEQRMTYKEIGQRFGIHPTVASEAVRGLIKNFTKKENQ